MDFSQTFWQASNSTETMSGVVNNLATNLTRWKRTVYQAPHDTTLEPQLFRTATVVQVTRVLLASPLTVCVITQVFFVATTLHTKPLHMRP